MNEFNLPSSSERLVDYSLENLQTQKKTYDKKPLSFLNCFMYVCILSCNLHFEVECSGSSVV